MSTRAMNDNTPLDAAHHIVDVNGMIGTPPRYTGSLIMMLGHTALWLWPLALFGIIEAASALL